LDCTTHSLVQAIMYVGYLKGAEDEREKMLVVEEPEKSVSQPENNETENKSSGRNDIVSLVNSLPRGSKFTQEPDGTIHVLL